MNRPFQLVTALAAAAALAAPAATAQTPVADGGLLPWIGCWEAVTPGDADGRLPGVLRRAEAPRLCVVPTADGGLELITVSRGEVLATTTVMPDGQRRPVQEAGCSGWESAAWSADGTRMHLRSELECESGVRRVGTGVMAMMTTDEWIDVQVVETAARTGTWVNRYRVAAPVEPVARRVTDLLEGRELAIETARLAAARDLSVDDVAETVRELGPEAAMALIAERGDPFELDASTLVALADAGVPGRVTDLMIAVSYPQTFVVDLGALAGDFRADPVPERAGIAGRTGREIPVWVDPFAFGGCPGFGFGGLSPWYFGGIDPWYFGSFGRSAFGIGGVCPSYGFRRGGFFGFGGYAPVIVIRDRRSGGEAIQGRGFTRGGDAQPTGRVARPRGGAGGTTATTGRRPDRGVTTSRPAVSRPAVDRDRSRSGSSDTGRRARPRDPND